MPGPVTLKGPGGGNREAEVDLPDLLKQRPICRKGTRRTTASCPSPLTRTPRISGHTARDKRIARRTRRKPARHNRPGRRGRRPTRPGSPHMLGGMLAAAGATNVRICRKVSLTSDTPRLLRVYRSHTRFRGSISLVFHINQGNSAPLRCDTAESGVSGRRRAHALGEASVAADPCEEHSTTQRRGWTANPT
jgi:hypothetical protein